jgi:hypothetical protein
MDSKPTRTTTASGKKKMTVERRFLGRRFSFWGRRAALWIGVGVQAFFHFRLLRTVHLSTTSCAATALRLIRVKEILARLSIAQRDHID